MLYIILVVSLIFISVALHETAHVAAAKWLGFKFKGLFFRWNKIGVKIEGDITSDSWLIPAAGLVATLYLFLLFAFLGLFYPVFSLLAICNLLLLIINTIPIKATDGWYIKKYIKRPN